MFLFVSFEVYLFTFLSPRKTHPLPFSFSMCHNNYFGVSNSLRSYILFIEILLLYTCLDHLFFFFFLIIVH